MLADKAKIDGLPYLVVVFGNEATEWTRDHPTFEARFEKAGPLFEAIKSAGCSRVVFAGGMDRPRLNPLKFDGKFLKLSSKLLPALKGGDGQTLRVVADIFETEGIEIVAAHDLLGDVLAVSGVLTKKQPNEADKLDAARAADIVANLSSLDIGQASVVAQGTCLAIETIQGTDEMLRFAATFKEEYRPDPDGGRGVLFKGPKTDQDRRMDLPTIGPDTIKRAKEAGLAGICTVAGGALILDIEAVVRCADEAGLFLWVTET